MNLLSTGKGKATKTGVGIAALGPLAQNVVNVLQGEEWKALVDAAQGTLGSLGVLMGAAIALFGSFRAAINYGE